MKLFLIHAFLLLDIALFGQPRTVPDNKIPPQQLQQDFNLFQEVLLNAHPKLDRIHTSSAFKDELDHYRSLLKDSLSAIEFFQVVSSAMSNVGEAHSNVSISEEIKNTIKAQAKLLPLNLHFENNRAFVLSDFSNDEISLNNYEIISINGRSIDTIIEQIDSISCIGTGNNKSRIYRKLSYDRNFALTYHLYVDQSHSYLIEYKSADNNPVKATVIEGIPVDFEVATILNPSEVTPPYSLSIDTHRNLATIKIQTFAHFIIGYKQKDYLKFYQESFQEIEESGVTNLVIDVRGNRGGQERLGGHLLSYLLDEPLNMQQYIFTRELDYEYLDSLKILHHTFDSKYFEAVDSGYVVTNQKHRIIAPIKPVKKNKFTGNVYILVDGNCFSACNIFAALADFHKAGTIIGEETGGNYLDTDGYYGVIFKLPNSGLGINFRLWHLRTEVNGQSGRGVIPQVIVQPSVEDIKNKKDTQMEKVYELIQSNK